MEDPSPLQTGSMEDPRAFPSKSAGSEHFGRQKAHIHKHRWRYVQLRMFPGDHNRGGPGK